MSTNNTESTNIETMETAVEPAEVGTMEASTYESFGPEFEGLDQNYDHIYEALREGATVYLEIYDEWEGITCNCLVTSWILAPDYGLILYASIWGNCPTEFAFTNGSYHNPNNGPR